MGAVALGIDVGSSGCKITAVDPNGRVVGRGQRAYETHYPAPGWAEQDPQDWLAAVRAAFAALTGSGRVAPGDLACVAISGATHTLVCLNEAGAVLRPAILWTDRRTLAEVEWLRREHGELIVGETLHSPNVNWTLPYLLWLREHERDVWSQIDTILMPKDYVRFRLTGHRGTDWMDAHGTLLFNVRERRWSTRTLNALNIPACILPEVLPPLQVVGQVLDSGCEELGIPVGIPVIVGTTDQACEAFGTGTIRAGSGLIKLATAGNVAIVTPGPHADPPHVYAYYHLQDGLWYTLSGTSSCAGCQSWVQDLLGEVRGREEEVAYANTEAAVSGVAAGSEGLIFHPHFQGSLSDPYLRAGFLGLTLRHTSAHLLRATLEGVAFSLYERLEKEEAAGAMAADFRIIGGGARSAAWRRIICDVFGRPLIRVEESDASFGTALLAGLAAGFFNGIEQAVEQCVRVVDRLAPDPETHARYRGYYEYYRQSQDALGPAYRTLHQLGRA